MMGNFNFNVPYVKSMIKADIESLQEKIHKIRSI
jgi:hypothetical protein